MTYTFTKICESSYISYLDLSKQIEEFPPVEYSEELSNIKDNQEAAGLKTIIFATMALESAIYDYAAIHLGDKYTTDYIDKLDILSKWVIVMRIVADHQYHKGQEPYNSLKQLITARNRLIHSKSEKLDLVNIKAQLTRIEEESAQIERDVHNAFRTLILISIDYELNMGRIGNPLISFIPQEDKGESPIKENLKNIVSTCYSIIKKKIRYGLTGRCT